MTPGRMLMSLRNGSTTRIRSRTRTVLRELDAGELVRVRVRGRVLVDPDSIRRYIARHREDSD